MEIFSISGYKNELLQLCLTLWDPMGCSLPDSSVHGILQARILEWVAISFSRGSSPPRDQTFVSYIYLHWQADSLPLWPSGKPQNEPTNMKGQKIFKKFFTDTPFKGWRKKNHIFQLLVKWISSFTCNFFKFFAYWLRHIQNSIWYLIIQKQQDTKRANQHQQPKNKKRLNAPAGG